MKKHIYLSSLFLPIILLILSGCRSQEEFESIVMEGEKPKAGFTYTSEGMVLTFTNTSQHAETYYWDFGDGTSSAEQSPVHAYAAAGNYAISLKVNSAAGYSDKVENEPILIADNIVAIFTATPDFGLDCLLDARSSPGIIKAVWDFGDGTTAEGLTIDHTFPTEGEYQVTLKAHGILGDTDEVTQKVTIEKRTDLLQGTDMEKNVSDYWITLKNDIDFEYGYTADKPSTGSGGCLRFAPFEGNGGTLIYQPVKVKAGRKYKLSAQVKAPAGAIKGYIQFYIAPNANSEDDFKENTTPETNHYLALNTWNGWGDNEVGGTAVDGDLYEECQVNGRFGLGAQNGGIYEATETRTVYIGIKVYTQISIGEVLIDNVLFQLQME